MPLEIERKFLVCDLPADLEHHGKIKQCYLQANPLRSVRVRITTANKNIPCACITIKGPAKSGHYTRHEFEYQIPFDDAERIMTLCDHPPIHKDRYVYYHKENRWEIDVFKGKNEGLLLAEIELQDETDSISIPPFVTKEVTGDPRFFNLYLAYHPYTTW